MSHWHLLPGAASSPPSPLHINLPMFCTGHSTCWLHATPLQQSMYPTQSVCVAYLSLTRVQGAARDAYVCWTGHVQLEEGS